MSITTRRGDDGGTDLMFGQRTEKTDPRVEAIGSLDELNAVLGVARVESGGAAEEMIDSLQGHLIGLMGELAVLPADVGRYRESGHPSICEDEVRMVESMAEVIEDGGVTFDGWARPGACGNRTGAHLDFARTVCRRAERRVLALGAEVPNAEIPVFLNRLSDLLWLMARQSEAGK